MMEQSWHTKWLEASLWGFVVAIYIFVCVCVWVCVVGLVDD